MNILIPDRWLRDFLKTPATAKQIKEYLSLCGPSIERINSVDNELVYDIEVTTNRIDSYSVSGIAREAAAILPRFGITAKFTNDPYEGNKSKNSKIVKFIDNKNVKRLTIKTDSNLNPRWMSVVLDSVVIKDSPAWLQRLLTLSGIRPLNSVVDVTNYVMRAYGQPVHAFDYDRIQPKKKIPFMQLRQSKQGETITTLDGKKHALPGGDIVIEDGSGELIDLCGIMGAENSSISAQTKTVVLLVPVYKPEHIRKTSMSLAHRTEAAAIFEKGVDTELARPALFKGISLLQELSQAHVAGPIEDIYPKPYKPVNVSVSRHLVDRYLGTKLSTQEIKSILTSLGFTATINAQTITVLTPGFRRDIAIDVDIIEEISRLYGYHHIVATLPETAPPFSLPVRELEWEEEIKVRLRDWGFTEIYSYSMISEALMNLFQFNTEESYIISNPLSQEWKYMRPSLVPGMLASIKQNSNFKHELQLFELSNVYLYQKNDLPHEQSTLLVAWTGNQFEKAKGMAEVLFNLFGIKLPPLEKPDAHTPHYWNIAQSISLGVFGKLGLVYSMYAQKMGINEDITLLELNFEELVKNAHVTKKYTPIPKHPPVIEDLSFVLPEQTPIGTIMDTIQKTHPAISRVRLISQYEQTATFEITYLDPKEQLRAAEVLTIRNLIISTIEKTCSAKLKGNHE